MSIEIKVPVLPESVADAVVLDWNKKVGDKVSRDEILVEVETDKVVLEVPSPADGILTEIVAQTGDVVEAEQLIAKLGEADSAPDTAAADDAASEQAEQSDSHAAPAAEAEEQGLSPAVRRMVEEYGLNVDKIAGSGRDGRVTKEDVLKYIENQVAPAKQEATQAPTQAPAQAATSSESSKAQSAPVASAATAPAKAVSAERQIEREPMSRLRQTIAKRLVECQQTAALLTTFNEVNMKPVMDLRSKYKDEFEKKHGIRLGFMSFFTKAAVAALQRYPMVNNYIDGNEIVKPNYNDVGIAVSSPRGLVVPVLRSVEHMSIAEIEGQIRDYGVRARDGKINLDELSGGTFTITNGGVFGSMLSTPIVNPPQSAILGMHNIVERPIAENGEVVIRPIMYLALSYDHRIVDGKEAVQFLVTIKEMIEDPARLLLEC